MRIRIVAVPKLLGAFKCSLLLGAWLLLLSTGLAASEVSVPVDETLEQNYQEKLKKPFVSAIEWESSLEKAKQLAVEKNRPIIAYFTRSYSP